MTLLSPRFAGYALVMLAMLAAGLSTGTRLYYLVFYALLAMLLLGAVAVVWTLATLRVTLKGVGARVERGERISLEIAEGILKGGTTVAAPAAETNPFLAPAGDLL